MKIYHYTSIDTLKKIISNKCIRFNRLDLLDDKSEYKHSSTVHDINIQLGRYTFVSCWTKYEMENIDLWNRYGRSDKGVRIGMDEDMFVTYDVGTQNKSFFNEREYYFQNFKISSYINSVSLKDVIYKQDIINYYKEAIKDFKYGIAFKYDNIGIYKKKEWELQNESRFIIHAIPFEPSLINNNLLSIPYSISEAYKRHMELSEKSLYIALKREAFDNMEIIMGAKTTYDDRVSVENMLKEHNINAIIKESALKGDL